MKKWKKEINNICTHEYCTDMRACATDAYTFIYIHIHKYMHTQTRTQNRTQNRIQI